jgi:hypothetical protein
VASSPRFRRKMAEKCHFLHGKAVDACTSPPNQVKPSMWSVMTIKKPIMRRGAGSEAAGSEMLALHIIQEIGKRLLRAHAPHLTPSKRSA